jgi:hypothetical protein
MNIDQCRGLATFSIHRSHGYNPWSNCYKVARCFSKSGSSNLLSQYGQVGVSLPIRIYICVSTFAPQLEHYFARCHFTAES